MTSSPRRPSPNGDNSNRQDPNLGSLAAPLGRRRFLRSLAAAGAVAAGGGALSACTGNGPADGPLTLDRSDDRRGETDAAHSAPGRVLPGAVADRILVVVDLQGGNDGLSTLIPAGDGRYYDLRPGLAVAEDEVLPLDDDVGLHPSLARLHRRGITTVEGVGPTGGDLSHFAMTERWERGDVGGGSGLRTGFLGRLADAVDDGSPLVGLSMLGPTAHLLTDRAATMALDGPDDLWFLEPSDWTDAEAYRLAIEAASVPAAQSSATRSSATQSSAARSSAARSSADVGATLLEQAAGSYRALSALAADLAPVRARDEDQETDWDHPMMGDGGQLGRGLYFAADLIAADVGVRVVYAADGGYDTHQDHRWQQADNLSRLDASIDGFLDRAEELGFAHRVLVATISEFGRRVPENDGGLDHGSGSTMLVAGPVANRRLGERSPLDDLDPDDNLRVGVGFDRYLAGLAQGWLGVDAASVLPDSPRPLDLV